MNLKGYVSRCRRRAKGLGTKALLGVALLMLAGSAEGREAVTWIESYDEAIEEARRTGKPIFLEYRCAP